MRWYRDLYVSKTIEKKVGIIKWKINHNVGMIDIYVIALASNKDNLFDIIPSRELLQKGYPKKNMYIIGLADGRVDAFCLIAKIVDEMYQKTGEFKVESYFS